MLMYNTWRKTKGGVMQTIGRIRVATGLIGVLLIFGVWGWAQPPQLASQVDPTQDNPKLQNTLEILLEGRTSALSKLAFTSQILRSTASTMRGGFFSSTMEGDQLRVVIEGVSANATDGIAEKIAELGGRVELIHGSDIQAFLPLEALEALTDLEEVVFIRLPVQPRQTDTERANLGTAQGSIISEGVSVIGAPEWQEAGLDGRGVKVGIIDVEFGLYRQLLGQELPPSERVIARSFISHGELYDPGFPEDAQVHGTGAAEIIHDIAPGATLYLAAFNTDVELHAAIDWVIQQKVDVISSSIGLDSGCFNGDGKFEPQIREARQSGITWMTAAGNEADIHWEGEFSDPDGDNLHNYTASDEGNTLDVILMEYEYPDGTVVATSIIFGVYSWDAPCTGASDDYEVVVMKEQGGRLVPVAEYNGAVGQFSDWFWEPGRPIKFFFASEDFPVSRVGEIEKYHLAIRKKRSSAQPVRLDVMHYGCPCSRIEYIEPRGSVGIEEPSISKNALAVGAIHHTPASCPSDTCPDGLLIYYSSQGPTKDGRIKPDIAAPSHVSTTVYGRWTGEGERQNPGFTGTSAATPHAAGAAALVVQALKQLHGRSPTPDEVQAFLEERARDEGEPGKDNKYGAGVLLLGQPPSQPQPPTISAIEPASGVQGSTLDAVITGTNLSGATAVTFSGEGVTATIREGGTDTTLPITITIAEDAPLGPRTFSVTTPGGTAQSGEVVFTVVEAPVVGELVVLRFEKLEFAEPNDWRRELRDGCVVYTNISEEPSKVRVTLPDESVVEYEIPSGNEVIVCDNVVHIDTRRPTES